MSIKAYYNEFDPYAAQWLRNLINAGQIAPGDVDSRNIKDVSADDLRGYTQCHFFAGIGVWSYALRRSRWPDERSIWTGSCPCQPFSTAGKGAGQDDDRHLWPVWFKLIEQCRPPVVFGEQVEAAIRHGWLDLVQGDLEAIGYASGAVCIPAGSVGAPHIRQRLWFVAHADSQRHHGEHALLRQGQKHLLEIAGGGSSGKLADTKRWSAKPGGQLLGRTPGETESAAQERQRLWNESGAGSDSFGQPGASQTDHFWRGADWLLCRDGKWRPVEPGTFPLAHGAADRVGRLRAYGNAIVPQVAQEVIEVFMEFKP